MHVGHVHQVQEHALVVAVFWRVIFFEVEIERVSRVFASRAIIVQRVGYLLPAPRRHCSITFLGTTNLETLAILTNFHVR